MVKLEIVTSVASYFVARTESFVSNSESWERFGEWNGELISPIQPWWLGGRVVD